MYDKHSFYADLVRVENLIAEEFSPLAIAAYQRASEHQTAIRWAVEHLRGKLTIEQRKHNMHLGGIETSPGRRRIEMFARAYIAEWENFRDPAFLLEAAE
jgi:hypothetical protein